MTACGSTCRSVGQPFISPGVGNTNFCAVVVLVTTLITMLWLEWRLTLLALIVLPLFIVPARRVGDRLVTTVFDLALAPWEEVVPFVASSGLEMFWPEGPTYGIDGLGAGSPGRRYDASHEGK